jgi:hypothetical protein
LLYFFNGGCGDFILNLTLLNYNEILNNCTYQLLYLPVGKFDKRVAAVVQAGGYQLALTMRDSDEKFAGESENLFAVERFGQSKLESVLAQADGGSELPRLDLDTNLNNFTTLLFISLFK